MSFFQRKAFKSGIPLVLFIVGGSFALKVVTEIRYRLQERRENFGLSSEAKRALRKSFAAADSSESSDVVQIKPKLKEVANSDEFVKEALSDFIQEVNKPLPALKKEDPEYKEKMEKLKAITGKKFSLEEEYTKLRQTDIKHWENKRVPRPYVEKDETDETEEKKD